jgi:hypothetical protein
MRSFLLVGSACLFLAVGSTTPALGQTESDAPGGIAAKERISVVVVLKPGESKQELLATWCTVGLTRSSGLEVGELRNGHFVTQIDKINRGQVWRKDGLTVQVPDAEQATKMAASAEFSALKEKGIDVFQLQVAAAEDARPGFYDLHIQDSTCGGTCRTELRVLVMSP